MTQPFSTGLGSFSQWIHLEAKDHDLEFIQTVLYFSTQILNRSSSSSCVDKEGGAICRRRTGSCRFLEGGGDRSSRSSVRAGNGTFHIHPKKVTEVRRDLFVGAPDPKCNILSPQMQNHSRVLIVFESPQSSCSRFRLRLERHHADVANVKLEEWRFINPYNLQVTIPSELAK